MGATREVIDADDPAVEPFRAVRDRDLVRAGSFIAEGTVVLRALLESRHFRPTALLVLRNRLAGIADLLEMVPKEVPILVAAAEVMDRIAGFPVHRGVLAHGIAAPLPEREGRVAELRRIARQGGSVVVAVGIANHDNVGAIFRNAAAFGAGMVLLDGRSCDPLYRKAIRVSAGAVLRLPFARFEPFEALGILKDLGFRTLALSPKGDPDLSLLERGGPAALFLGTEGEGLPASLMAAMECVRIDMVPGFDSLNVATSAAIALQRLYAARRQASG